MDGWRMYLRAPDLLIPAPLWRLWRIVRHPRVWYSDWRKWHDRPAIGEWIEDCRYQVHQVVRFGGTEDDLILDDGHSASWMSCCDRAEKPGGKEKADGNNLQPGQARRRQGRQAPGGEEGLRHR
jgi:hypothetical protein